MFGSRICARSTANWVAATSDGLLLLKILYLNRLVANTSNRALPHTLATIIAAGFCHMLLRQEKQTSLTTGFGPKTALKLVKWFIGHTIAVLSSLLRTRPLLISDTIAQNKYTTTLHKTSVWQLYVKLAWPADSSTTHALVPSSQYVHLHRCNDDASVRAT